MGASRKGLHGGLLMEDKNVGLDGRVTALTVTLKHLFELLERKSRPFQSARSCSAMHPPNWSKFPLCPLISTTIASVPSALCGCRPAVQKTPRSERLLGC